MVYNGKSENEIYDKMGHPILGNLHAGENAR